MIDLSGRVVLVTGGSRGIGRATAELAARAGADVAITYHTRQADAAEVTRTLRGLGRKALAAGGDLADPSVVTRVMREVRTCFGQLDGFVANAGTWPPAHEPLAGLSPERWRRTMATNLDAVFHTTRAALDLMGPGGRVVLVASTAAQRGEAGHADYAASKGALVSLTKSLAVECAPDIAVNCVAPGWVDTEMSAGSLHGPDGARIASTIPLGRAATAAEVAGPIVFLLSALAAHVTGEVLNVNGGSVLCG